MMLGHEIFVPHYQEPAAKMPYTERNYISIDMGNSSE